MTTVSSWARLDAALFWTEARQLIEPTFLVDPSGVAKIQVQNISRARLRGLDASLAMTPTPSLTGAIAYLLLGGGQMSQRSRIIAVGGGAGAYFLILLVGAAAGGVS